MSRLARLGALLLLAASIPAAVAKNPFGLSVVFGDSFTDYFNMYAYRGQPGPPYYAPGRRCNGPVWIEYFSNASKIANVNYAYEGSVSDHATVFENCPGTPFMNHTCRQQVSKYIADYQNGLPNTQVYPTNRTGNLSTLLASDERILSLIACGIVDIQTSYNWQCWNKTNSTLLPKLIADSQLGMIRDLYEKTDGRDFLLVNLFPVNMTMDNNTSPPGAIATMQMFVDEANARLLSGAAAFVREKGDARVEIVDWWSAIARIYRDAKDPALKEWFGEEEVIVYGVCLKGDPNGDGIVEACANPDRYFYYDGHFSTTAQRYLSDFTLPYLAKLDKDAWTVTTTTTRAAPTVTGVVTTSRPAGAGKVAAGLGWAIGFLAGLLL